MQPIETFYNGYRFRSRLEARWAVFLSVLSVPFEYEREGFQIGGIRYLPDFWLPEQHTWLEVKGNPDLKDSETAKIIAFNAGLEARNKARQPEDEWGVMWVCVGEPYLNGLSRSYEVFSPVTSADRAPELMPWTNACWTECPTCSTYDIRALCDRDDSADVFAYCQHCGSTVTASAKQFESTATLQRAYGAARSARF